MYEDSEFGLLVRNGGTISIVPEIPNTETLSWICRLMGYNYSSYHIIIVFDDWILQRFPVKYTNLECSGDYLPQCSYSLLEYPQTLASLIIRCDKRSTYGDYDSFHLVDSSRTTTQQGYGDYDSFHLVDS